jgi:hypothetical protein
MKNKGLGKRKKDKALEKINEKAFKEILKDVIYQEREVS